MREKHLIDVAVLLATHAFSEPISEGISERDGFLIVRKGAHVFILYEPHKLTRLVRSIVGDMAFVHAVTSGPHPESYSRAFVRLYAPKNGEPRLIAYQVPLRLKHRFDKDRTPRMKMNTASAELLPSPHGRGLNKGRKTENLYA